MTSASPPATGRRPVPGDRTIQVFAPHKASLPPLGPYLRNFRHRLRFSYELARTQEKANHFDSPLGAAWLVLNPMLLGIVCMAVPILQGSRAIAAVALHAPVARLSIEGARAWLPRMQEAARKLAHTYQPPSDAPDEP